MVQGGLTPPTSHETVRPTQFWSKLSKLKRITRKTWVLFYGTLAEHLTKHACPFVLFSNNSNGMTIKATDVHRVLPMQYGQFKRSLKTVKKWKNSIKQYGLQCSLLLTPAWGHFCFLWVCSWWVVTARVCRWEQLRILFHSGFQLHGG